ncbi:NAD(P)/FAD-dependent oxidoreductase [Nocardioides sp. LS1]|uniref:NAD(P)/FAD-dependent oxidoreductase n=1 Tax=Nocardioides sp. LS1 TaxID=1027620 RepID=UPI0021AB340A|nr:FAD-dependent oxidoreductase [Nocardioides sp. LS1]
MIVAGGGIAGVSVVTALRSGGYLGEIVLIDEAELPYDRPPLSKDFLSGPRDLEEIALRPLEWYAENHVELVAKSSVQAFAASEDRVEVRVSSGAELAGEYLVLATGGRATVPALPGLVGAMRAGRVHTLRDHQDAERLRQVLKPGTRLLIVGAGLIGAEVASTAALLGCKVVLVDPLDPPLAGATGRDVAKWLHDEHRAHGVESVVGSLLSLQPTSAGIAAQLDSTDASREFDAILIGIGITPRSDLAEDAGLEVDRGVLVDARQVASHPRVLAIGDVARVRDQHRTEHWEAAKHDGERAAATILGIELPSATASWWWSDRHGRHIEGVGNMSDSSASTSIVVRGAIGADSFSVFTMRNGRIIGAVAADDSQAVRAARRLIDRQIAVDPDCLADTGSDLRKLLRR